VFECRYLCTLSAFLVEQHFLQISQMVPMSKCLDSMCWMTLCLILLINPHSRQSQSPVRDLCIFRPTRHLSQDLVLECLVGRKMQRSLTGDWLCLECGLINKIKQRVIQHIESKHLDIGTICEICKKCCSTRNALRVHKYRHHKPESS
jgi:hypothetical protein